MILIFQCKLRREQLLSWSKRGWIISIFIFLNELEWFELLGNHFRRGKVIWSFRLHFFEFPILFIVLIFRNIVFFTILRIRISHNFSFFLFWFSLDLCKGALVISIKVFMMKVTFRISLSYFVKVVHVKLSNEGRIIGVLKVFR